MRAKRVAVIGAAGRVGSQIVFELLRHQYHLVLVDSFDMYGAVRG